jgi:hypothetical protein
MLSTLLILATAISPTTLNSRHVPVSINSVHDSVTTQACSRAYFAGEAPYIVLDIEPTDDPATLAVSVHGVNALASSLATPIGIVVRSQAAVDALVKNEPVTFSYHMPNGNDGITISFPADPDLHCK